MWHELVLHGIGGRTIAEAKERLSYSEALDWFAYIRKRGTLHDGMRLEASTALLAMLIVRALGSKDAEQADFMPHYETQETSIEDVMKELMGG